MDTVVMDGAIAAAEDIITGGAEVVATTMAGGIIAITGDLSSILLRGRSVWRPLWCSAARAMSPTDANLGCSGQFPCWPGDSHLLLQWTHYNQPLADP
jgi:hypothetical protein